MMNTDVLKDLRDIHMPEAPSVWPLAIGYYVVLVLLGIAVVAILYYVLIERKNRRLKKEIWQELNALDARYQSDGDNAAVQAGATALLKRLVFLKNRRELSRASDLDDLMEALNEMFPNQEKTAQLIALIKKDRFSKQPDIDGALLLTMLREQIKRCRI